MKRPLFAFAVISLIGAFFLPSVALSAPAPSTILVMPFAPTGNAGAYDWVGKGIQQSLQADLSGVQGLQVTFSTGQGGQPAPTGQEPTDSLATSSRVGANLVVIGTYQINDNQLRITGEIYDVSTWRNIGGIKATGAIADLFKLEDSLNDQLLHMLSRNPNVVNIPLPLPQQQQQPPAQSPVVVTTADDGASSLPVTASTAPTYQNVYVYSDGSSGSYYPASYYPYYPVSYYGYYSVPFYSCAGFCSGGRFCSSPRFFCSAPRVGFHGGGGFVGVHGGGGFVAFHGGGFAGGFHGGGMGGGFHGGGGHR
jgi:TolB-like protein